MGYTRYTFEKIKETGSKTNICPICGGKKRVSKVFCQTINPFNINAIAVAKSEIEIRRELRKEIELWKKEQQICNECKMSGENRQ